MQATHGQMLKQFVACIFHLFVISLATGNCFQGLEKNSANSRFCARHASLKTFAA